MIKIKTSKYEFVIEIDDKNIEDMKHVMQENIQFGYKQIVSEEYNNNHILIMAKKVEKLSE